MVLGSYPCCGAALAITVPDKAPAYFREACPTCGAIVWHRLSRLDPQSWTEADFLAEHEIDDETRTIREKNHTPSHTLEQIEIVTRRMENLLLYGDTEGPKPGPEPVGLLFNSIERKRK